MSKREREQRLCDCGCKRKVYLNQLVRVTVDEAVDHSLRVSKTKSRFWVTRQCKESFEEELGLMILLEQLVSAWTPRPRSRWWLVDFWFNPSRPWIDLYRWWRRIGASRRVMQIQHIIWERNKGFAYARARAMQSAILFASPRFIQGFLARRFMGRLKRIEESGLEGLPATSH